MIELKNIKKAFDDDAILNGVNLQVNKGEVVVILGPSGSGKTTLLRTINLLNPADQGELIIDGEKLDYTRYSKKQALKIRRKTAMVFQNYNLFCNKTVLENITIGLTSVKKKNKKEAEDIAKQLLEKVNLADKAHVYPGALSGGQQQRVGICRALALHPEVILFDEPTSALDPELVGEVLNTMKDVARLGVTMIVVTHEIAFAREVADKVVYMEGGKVIEQGAPEDILNHPKDERVIRFLRRLLPNQNYDYVI